MPNNQLDLGKVTPVEGEDLSVLEHMRYNAQKNEMNSDCSLVELMEGYSAIQGSDSINEFNPLFVSVCKNGNKITFVVFGEFTRLQNTSSAPTLCDFVVPQEVYDKLYPSLYDEIYRLDCKVINAFQNATTYVPIVAQILKRSGQRHIGFDISNLDGLTLNQKYMVRVEATFLLSDNLIS